MLQVKTKYRCDENYRGSGDWASWRQRSTTTVTGINRIDAQESDRYEQIFDADAVEGSVAYVLSITYKSGDSFGAESGCHKIIGVFTDKNQAQIAKKIVESSFDTYGDSDVYEFVFKFTNSKGEEQEAQVRNPASGYFESIESIDLDGFVVM